MTEQTSTTTEHEPPITAVKKIDWLKKLQDEMENNWLGYKQAIQILFLANKTNALETDQALQLLTPALTFDSINQQEIVDLALKDAEAYPDNQTKKNSYDRRKKELDAIAALLDLVKTKPDQAQPWLTEQFSRLDAAIIELNNVFSEVSTQIISLFEGVATSIKINPQALRDSFNALLAEEYLALAYIAHPSNPVDFAYRVAAFADIPERGRNRGVAVRVDVTTLSFMATEPSTHDLMAYPETKIAAARVRHEALHVVTDQTIKHAGSLTHEGKNLDVEQRGFRTFLYVKDGEKSGQIHHGASLTITEAQSLQAIDEGAVVLMEHLPYNTDAEPTQKIKLAEEAINRRRNSFSQQYVEAALITAEYAKVVGLEKLLQAYITSDLSAWLAAIRNVMGEEKLREYQIKMKDIQSKMTISMSD